MPLFSRVLVLAALLTAAAGVAALVGTSIRAGERAERIEHGEMPLFVSNPSHAALRLLKSGDTLDDARPLGLAEETWLAEGRYFVEARGKDATWSYPVPVLGSGGGGPDAEGSLAIVVRDPGPPPVADGRFVFIPGGHFLIGDRKNPLETHFVWVAGFYLDAFEVTNGEFRRFLADPHGYADRRYWTDEGWSWKTANACAATARLAPGDADYARFGQDDQPVVLVTWYEASAFGRWMTARAGKGRWLYRMPTEAEWEKAARGPDSFDYGLGNFLSEPEQRLYNWKKNPDAGETLVGWAETRRRFRPNRYGVYHASGNAAEWTQSLFQPYSRERPYADDGRNLDTGAGMRTTRGGSWYSANTVRLFLGYREEFQPELRSNDLGFRIAAFPLP